MTLPAVTATQRSVSRFNPLGRRGAVASSFPIEDLNVLNSGADAFAVSTLTVGAASAKTYETAVLGLPVSFTASGTDGVNDVAAGLAAAINNDPAIAGQVYASSAAAVVTITAQFPGMTLGVDGSDTDLTAAVVAAGASSPEIGFGRVVILSQAEGADAAGRLPATATDLLDDGARPPRAITVARHDIETGADQIARYKPNTVMRCARRAELYYDGFQAGDREVFVGTAAGEEGVLFRAAGAGRVSDPALTVLRVGDDGIAVIRCEFPA